MRQIVVRFRSPKDRPGEVRLLSFRTAKVADAIAMVTAEHGPFVALEEICIREGGATRTIVIGDL